MKPQIFTTCAELQQWRSSLSTSLSTSIGFVPTMGALHEGHTSLLQHVRTCCQISVLSIFINPTQFGPKEDFASYPKTWEADLETAARAGVDIIFAPSSEELYPSNYSTYIEEINVSRPLCGHFRPHFFRGVTTIVLKLFNLVQPHLAVFGLKDAQQFFVIKKMVKDLNLNIHVEGLPTIRETDGLAMSSRNRYLSSRERQIAPALFRELAGFAEKINTLCQKDQKLSCDQLASLLHASQKNLEEQTFQVQYLDCLQIPSLTPITARASLPSAATLSPSYLIAVAAFLGQTRLIDNIIISNRMNSTSSTLIA